MAGELNVVSRGVRIRAFHAQDAETVRALIEESLQAANWSKESYLKTLDCDGVSAFVSETNDQITGFVIARQVADEGEILNMAVHQACRRGGEGSALLSAVLEEFRRGRVRSVFLEVRETNRAAIAFYEKHGFRGTGRRPHYYREPEEAAVTLEKKLTG